jgi:hypothetical protein
LARKLQPSIIFIGNYICTIFFVSFILLTKFVCFWLVFVVVADEIDALLSRRQSEGSCADVDNSVKAGFMTQWDGLTKMRDCHVIVRRDDIFSLLFDVVDNNNNNDNDDR